MAEELDCHFTYAERSIVAETTGLFPVRYSIPRSLTTFVTGKRVAIVNDVISAGSAVRGTFNDLARVNAHVVAVGALSVLGDQFGTFVQEHGLNVEALSEASYHLWIPDECPLCRQDVALETVI